MSMALTGCGQKKKSYEDLLTEARDFVSNKNYEDAQTTYLTAIEEDAQKADAYLELTDIYVTLNLEQKAYDTIQKAKENVAQESLQIISDKEVELDKLYKVPEVLYLEATDADFETFEQKVAGINDLVNWHYDCENLASSYIQNANDGTQKSFEELNLFEIVDLYYAFNEYSREGYKQYYKTEREGDPLSRFDQFECSSFDGEMLDSILLNNLNITPDHDYTRDDWYFNGDRYYLNQAGEWGNSGRNYGKIQEYQQLEDGKYVLKCEIYRESMDGSTTTEGSCTITAGLKDIDGQHVWGIFKVESSEF